MSGELGVSVKTDLKGDEKTQLQMKKERETKMVYFFHDLKSESDKEHRVATEINQRFNSL